MIYNKKFMFYLYPLFWRAALVAQLLKSLPAMWETWVRSLGWDDPLEKGKAAHSSILAWRFHGLYSPWGLKELDTTEQVSLGRTVSDLDTERKARKRYPRESLI